MSKALIEAARKVANRKVEELTEDYPGKGKNKEESPRPMGSSVKPKVEPLYRGSGAGKGVKSAQPLAPKVKEFQAKPLKQGSSQDAPSEDLDSSEVGKRAAAKAKKDTTLPKGNGAGKAPNFDTKGDPTKVVSAASSDGNVHQGDGNVGPTRRVAEDEEVIELTDEEFDALTPEEQAELVPVVEEEVEEEVLDEKVKADKGKKEKSDDEQEKSFEAKRKTHKEELSLDVKTLFASETELSEEFKEKASALFEAAVAARVAIDLEEATDVIAEEALVMLDEHKSELTERVNEYLTATAQEWLDANEVALEDSLKTEITEGFIEALRNTFAEHYIEVPTEKYDVLNGLQEEIDALKAVVAETEEESDALAEELLAMKKGAVIAVVSEGLAQTEIEKFRSILEDVTYEDDETYEEKLKTIKENFFRKKGTKLVEGEIIDVEEEVKAEPTGAMARYVRAGLSAQKNRG